MDGKPETGVLIAFEGIDGAGKTTQARRLAAAIRAGGREVVETKEPTSGVHGQRIRASATRGRMSARDEFEAFVADRRQHVEEVIRPALARGAVVIVDRYFISSAAYQGARGIPPDDILEANEGFAPLPDAVYLLDVTVAEGLARIDARGDGTNLFEREDDLRRVRDVFHALDRAYIVRIDGSGSADEVAAAISAHVRTLPGLGAPA